MSDSNKVKITNKRTGEVSSAQTARSAMQWKDDKPGMEQGAEDKNVEPAIVEKSAPDADQSKDQSGPPGATSSAKKSSKKKPAKVEINSLADFIAYAYSRKGQNLKSLAPGEVKAVTSNARLSEREFDDLLSLSKSDPLLAVPRQIVLAVLNIDGPSLARQEVRRLVPEVLKQHPLFQQVQLVDVIANLDGAPEPVEAIRKIAKLGHETLASLTGLERPKTKDAEALRSNAINCLAMWLWESRGQQVNRVIRWLHEGYWSEVARADARPSECLQVVTGVTEISGIGTACQLFKAEAEESALRAARLQSRIDSLQDEIAGLHQDIRELEGSVQERDRTIDGLSRELDAERSAHANSRAHLGDDREHLRSNVVRRLKREVSLLNEGLQALRKDPPKVRVMDDHAERVLEGLQAAMKELEEED